MIWMIVSDIAQWVIIIVLIVFHHMLKTGIQHCWDYMTDFSVEKRINRVIEKAGSNYEQLLHQMTSMRKASEEERIEYDLVLRDHKHKIEGLLRDANTSN